MSPGIAVAVIPEEFYRKPKGVQFKKSFRRREYAIRYAEEHSCRVVIACEAENRYEVLCDPSSIRGPKVNFDLVVEKGELVAMPRRTQPEDELPEPVTKSGSDITWTTRKTAWNFVNTLLRA